MKELSTNTSILSDDGSPLYFHANKRFPIEQVYESVKPFDEISYLSTIAQFIVSHPTADFEFTFSDVVNTYVNSGLDAVYTRFLKKIVPERAGIIKQLEQLYSLGCPELYLFHKTAEETVRFKSDEIVPANPLAMPQIDVTPDFQFAYNYARVEDKNRYVMAFPALDLYRAEESRSGQTRGALSLHLNQVQFGRFDSESLSNITQHMKIYRFDAQTRVKLLDFQLKSNLGALV